MQVSSELLFFLNEGFKLVGIDIRVIVETGLILANIFHFELKPKLSDYIENVVIELLQKPDFTFEKLRMSQKSKFRTEVETLLDSFYFLDVKTRVELSEIYLHIISDKFVGINSVIIFCVEATHILEKRL